MKFNKTDEMVQIFIYVRKFKYFLLQSHIQTPLLNNQFFAEAPQEAQ
jgi:hypothetical protein